MVRQFFWAVGAVALMGLRPAWALPKGPDLHAAKLLRVSVAAAKAVVSAPIAPACLHTTLKTAGRVTYDDLRVAHVLSPVSGRVDQVLAKPGDTLQEGAVLATIRSPDFATARADWHKAQVALESARRDLMRQDGLYKRHAAPEQVVLAAWDAYRRAVSERDRAKGSLGLLGGTHQQGNDDAYRLRTPIAGVVVSRSMHPGMEVAGQYGGGSAQELFLVADLSQVWVVAEVPEAEVGRITRNANVVVHVDALPNTPLTGQLDYVADTLDPNVHTGHVRCVVSNTAGKLKPDMYATLIIDAAGVNALAVPKEALLHMADAAFIYVEQQAAANEDSTMRLFERRHVTADEGDEAEFIPITHGLKIGDRVVTHGADTLRTLQEAQP